MCEDVKDQSVRIGLINRMIAYLLTAEYKITSRLIKVCVLFYELNDASKIQ